MTASGSECGNLAAALAARPEAAGRVIASAEGEFRLGDLATSRGVCAKLAELADRTVVLAASQLATTAALIDLDGLARRIIICPPDLSAELVDWTMAETGADALISDRPELSSVSNSVRRLSCGQNPNRRSEMTARQLTTEWIFFTSGTTGRPKLAIHGFAGLIGAIPGVGAHEDAVWGTFYDIRRYGGMQILLRFLVGGGAFALAGEGEPLSNYLRRLAERGATHISGTPSHWRAVLMNPDGGLIAPRYVRLSGEIVDQSILEALRERFPKSQVVHAFASTEAGVAFEVRDGLAGFPPALLDQSGEVQLRLTDGTLRVRSPRAALAYVGGAAIREPDGFVDTGDLVEVREDRCYFLGRRGGIINIGGLKVHPEEVECVINRCEGVRASLVRARRNPILGALVVADVVLDKKAALAAEDNETILRVLQRHCRERLAAYKAPAAIRIVDSLEMAPSGKLARYGQNHG